MMPREYNSVEEDILKRTLTKWETHSVDFELCGCKCIKHRDNKTGAMMCLLCLIITSKDIELLRRDLQLEDADFSPHMTVLEAFFH